MNGPVIASVSEAIPSSENEAHCFFLPPWREPCGSCLGERIKVRGGVLLSPGGRGQRRGGKVSPLPFWESKTPRRPTDLQGARPGVWEDSGEDPTEGGSEGASEFFSRG